MDIMETRYYYFIMTLRTLTLNWLACFPASNLSFLLLLSPFHYRKKFICYCTFIKGHSYSRKISKSGSLWYCDCAQTDFEKCAMVYSQNSLWKLHARSCSKLLTNMVSTFSKFGFFFFTKLGQISSGFKMFINQKEDPTLLCLILRTKVQGM